MTIGASASVCSPAIVVFNTTMLCFVSSRRRHTRCLSDWSSDVCSSDLETTVSRAVSGKYMQTPQGIFEMKYFFTAGIQTATGDVSNTTVKDMIAEIFKQEDPSKIGRASCRERG